MIRFRLFSLGVLCLFGGKILRLGSKDLDLKGGILRNKREEY
jgi:hypothetical protein